MTIATSPERPSFQHFILTRFWFAQGPGGAIASPSEARPWLENRLELFKSYCLSSVVNQSCQDFKWIIYSDVLTPPDFVSKMRDIVSPYGNIEVATVGSWGVPTAVPHYRNPTTGTSEIFEDLKRRVERGTDWLLTTRLDTDDGIHREFVKRLHEAVGERWEGFLNFPNGILYFNGQCYLYHHPSNAFISLFEPVANMKTVICGPHEWLNEVGPVRQLSPLPAFIQVVHGSNDSNKIRGYRVPKILALQGFEAIPSLFAPPLEESNADIIFNNVLWGTVRSGRDRLWNGFKGIRRSLEKRDLLR